MGNELALGSSKGIKETSELIQGLNKLVLLVLKKTSGNSKNLSIFELMGMLVLDPDFRLALEGIGHVKDELKDLSADESLKLVGQVLAAIPGWISASKS